MIRHKRSDGSVTAHACAMLYPVVFPSRVGEVKGRFLFSFFYFCLCFFFVLPSRVGEVKGLDNILWTARADIRLSCCRVAPEKDAMKGSIGTQWS